MPSRSALRLSPSTVTPTAWLPQLSSFLHAICRGRRCQITALTGPISIAPFPDRLAGTPSVGLRVPHAMGGGPLVFISSIAMGLSSTSLSEDSVCLFTAYNRLSVPCCLAVWLGGGRPALLAAPRRRAAPVARGMGVRSEALPPGTISGVLGVC